VAAERQLLGSFGEQKVILDTYLRVFDLLPLSGFAITEHVPSKIAIIRDSASSWLAGVCL